MKAYTQSQFNDKILESWEDITGEESVIEQVLMFTGGTILDEHQTEIQGSHDVYFAVIEDPTHQLTPGQLCQLFDEGNHCLSQGAIVYEDPYAYITWSNYGHI
jgi:hypothetical protein